MSKARLLDQVRDRIQTLHYSIRTEQSYISWIKRFILFNNKRHPTDMGSLKLKSFSPFWLLNVMYLHQLRIRL